jgi:hypothetical protein
VSYRPENHIIRGALVYHYTKHTAPERPYTVGVTVHPMAERRNKCNVSLQYRQYCYLVAGCDPQGIYRGTSPGQLKSSQRVGETPEEIKNWERVRLALVQVEMDEMNRRLLKSENWPSPYERWVIDATAHNMVLSGTSRQGELQLAESMRSKNDALGFLRDGHPHCLYYLSKREEIERASKEEAEETARAEASLAVAVKHPCPHCTQSFYQIEHLESHLESKSTLDGHPKYSWDEYLERERGRGHSPCSYCYRSFFTEEQLQTHLYNKAGDETHPDIGAGTKSSGSGSRTETEKQWSQCPDCKRYFSSEQGLQSHQWSSKEDKKHPKMPSFLSELVVSSGPYQCIHCKLRFENPEDLSTHLYWLSGDKHPKGGGKVPTPSLSDFLPEGLSREAREQRRQEQRRRPP